MVKEDIPKPRFAPVTRYMEDGVMLMDACVIGTGWDSESALGQRFHLY